MTSRPLNEMVTPALLDEVAAFWFRHMPESDHIIALDVEDCGPWFFTDPSFDKECIEKFAPALETIIAEKPNADEILAAAKPATPLHWVSLIILLDQLSRNCFRGARIGIAYTFFDPLALEVGRRAIEQGVPEDPEVRFRLAYKFWFYMPMEHSEDIAVQETLTKEHARMFADYESLMDSPEPADKNLAHYRDVLRKRRASYEKFKGTIRGICDSHKDMIISFGRYPYRNEVLNRTSSQEEMESLRRRAEQSSTPPSTSA